MNIMNFRFLNIIEDDDKRFMLGLYKQYYPLMKQKAYSIVGKYDVVDDLIQDALLKLIPKISLLRTLGSNKVASYVVNTIKHICFDHIRKETRRVQHHIVGSNEDVAVQIPDLQAATEENYVKREEIDALEEILFQLSERDRNLLYYKYNMGFSDKEIEVVLGVPAQYVRQYVARARQRVLKLLSKGDSCDDRNQ